MAVREKQITKNILCVFLLKVKNRKRKKQNLTNKSFSLTTVLLVNDAIWVRLPTVKICTHVPTYIKTYF